jgi:hypothetical protein
MFQVLQVDDYRDSVTVIFTNGDSVLKISRTHYRDLDTVAHAELATRGVFVDVLGSVPALVDDGVIVMLDGTEPITGVAWHYADLRRYEPIQSRP